jgi:hypothetical protein
MTQCTFPDRVESGICPCGRMFTHCPVEVTFDDYGNHKDRHRWTSVKCCSHQCAAQFIAMAQAEPSVKQ